MSEFTDRTIVLGVCGGIAAYKAADLVSKLSQAGANVRVVMTANAQQFITPVTFQALSGNPVYTETFAAPEAYGMGHLSLAGSADLLLVAPATANLLAKAATGIADDLLSTTILSVTCPVLHAPAMNHAMWDNPIVQRNVAALREVGHQFVGPGSGWLACREVGAGRLADTAEILAAVRPLLGPRDDYAGRTVLITAGPTREAIDAVRFISNPSSGKQGYALAAAAAARGAEVILVSGPTALAPPRGVETVNVVSAAEMLEAVLTRCGEADVVIGAAAVADHTPAHPAPGKPPKSTAKVHLELVPTVDIIGTVGQRKRPGQVVVAFAAQTDRVLELAAQKRLAKQADVMVANDISAPGAGFAGDTNQVTILGPGEQVVEVPPGAKLAVAHALLDHLLPLLD